MTTSSRTYRRLTVSFLAAAVVAGLAAASPAAGTSHPGSRQDYTSWLTNPTAEPRHDRGGHQQELLHPQDRPRLTGSQGASIPSVKRSPSTEHGSLDYTQIALGGLAGAVIVAAVAGILVGRRRRRLPLEAALASNPDDIPRAAGLLGDLFVRQSQAGAAEHAYRAAIDADHPYWSPVAQVALAQLLGDGGHGDEAKTLLADAIASGHPRTASVAQASLSELSIGDKSHAAVGPSLDAYETLSDPMSAHRSQVVSDTAARAPAGSTVARRASKSALAGLVGLAAGIAATTVLVSELGAETAVSTAVERQESVAVTRHQTGPRTADTGAWLESHAEYTGPTTPDAAEHWIRWLHRNEDRIVRHQIDRIASGQISIGEFQAIADTRVTNGDWTQDMVDRIVKAARARTLARLYQGCQVYSAGGLMARAGC